MNLTPKDIIALRTALGACKVIGIDAVVIHEGMIRGAKPSLDAAIISPIDLSISEALRLGLGRVNELDKRLALFTGPTQIDGKSNEAGDVSLLTIISGKTKMQFRCTSANLIKYPKSNDDAPVVIINFTKSEVQQISKAVKILGAEQIVLQVREGCVKLECSDSSNDRFEIELSTEAKYMSERSPLTQTYLSDLFVGVIDAAAKETEEVELIIGEVGSITAIVGGHVLMIMPRITGD